MLTGGLRYGMFRLMRRSSFATAMSKRMKEKKIGVRALSRLTGIDAGFISKILNDQRPPPSEDKIKKIAKALDMPGDDLIIISKKIPKKIADGILKIINNVKFSKLDKYFLKKVDLVAFLDMVSEAMGDDKKKVNILIEKDKKGNMKFKVLDKENE